MELGAGQWSAAAREMDGCEVPQVPGAASESDTTSGPERWPNGERMRWLLERRLRRLPAGPNAGRSGRTPWERGGLWRRGEVLLCFSRAFCSPMPVRTRAPESPPLLHTAREGLGATRKGRLGRTWDVAVCTPHRLLSAMLLLFVRLFGVAGIIASTAACVRAWAAVRSPCSSKACWQHCWPCPSFPLIQIANSPSALERYLACSRCDARWTSVRAAQ